MLLKFELKSRTKCDSNNHCIQLKQRTCIWNNLAYSFGTSLAFLWLIYIEENSYRFWYIIYYIPGHAFRQDVRILFNKPIKGMRAQSKTGSTLLGSPGHLMLFLWERTQMQVKTGACAFLHFHSKPSTNAVHVEVIIGSGI